jgi:hypothetical protein
VQSEELPNLIEEEEKDTDRGEVVEEGEGMLEWD